MNSIFVHVEKCIACGGEHYIEADILLHPERGDGKIFTHGYICPTTGLVGLANKGMIFEQEEKKMKTGAEMIMAERSRQLTTKGFTPEHDDHHTNFELSSAAMCYLLTSNSDHIKRYWPWDWSWWKPSPFRIRNLVKAGALIAAEIDRLQRYSVKNAPPKISAFGLEILRCSSCGSDHHIFATPLPEIVIMKDIEYTHGFRCPVTLEMVYVKLSVELDLATPQKE